MVRRLALAAILPALAWGQAAPAIPPSSIAASAARIAPDLVAFRRDLHRHPELAGQEVRTAAQVRAALEALGLEVHTGIGGHGVVGVLKGKRPGRMLAWRADMDALPSTFLDPVPFASETKGVRHGCGHDVHTTIGLGIARVLNTLKEDLAGTVLFIFQPAEETFEGARKMLASPFFDSHRPEAVFALHLAPLPTGLVSTKEREVYWAGRTLTLELEGLSDADRAVTDLRKMLLELSTQPEGSPYFDPATLGTREHNPGNPSTLYRDYLVVRPSRIQVSRVAQKLRIEAEVEASSQERFPEALSRLQALLKVAPFGANIRKVGYTRSLPTVFNRPADTQAAVRSLKANFGEAAFQTAFGVNPFSNDDFALFQERFGGVYFFLGASDFAKGIVSMPHAPHFQVDETVIETGVVRFATLLHDLLNASTRP